MAINPSTLKTQDKDSAPESSLPVRFAKKAKYLIPLLVFSWPFIFLCHIILPGDRTFTVIGNDFYALYYKYKLYFLASLAQGHFPLWSPSEAAGYPFFSNPFAQTYYPLNLLLLPFYQVSGGYTPLDHQVFTVLGLGIFALGLYCWLRLIVPNTRAVIVGVLIMSISFKMTEIIRFPNAVHSAAWYPWILYGITKQFFSTSAKGTFLNAFIIFFSVVCLCTAGYPYYIYYAFFLFPPYLCIMLWRPLRESLFGSRKIAWKRSIIALAIPAVIACILCAPYLIAIRGLLSETADRGGKNGDYSTAYVFNISDTLGSLIYPPMAQTEGWYFFTITALLIIIIYLSSFIGKPGVGQNQKEGTLSTSCVYPAALGVLVLIGWMAVISYITYGKESFLFKLFWNYLPGFSSLRVWGRMNIILVVLLAWLLSASYSHFESLLFNPQHSTKQNRIKAGLALMTGYLPVLIIQLYFYINNMRDSYWDLFPDFSPYRIHFILFGLIAFAAILFLLIVCGQIRRPVLGYIFVMALMVLLAATELRPVGANTWIVNHVALFPRKILQVSRDNEMSFETTRQRKYDTIPLSPAFQVGTLDNWYFARYVAFLKQTQDESPFQNILLGAAKDPQRVFISESLSHSTIQSFLNDSMRFHDIGQMQSYTGDELAWEVTMPINGYFSFIDNWDPYWKAYADDRETPIELLFGTFKSIHLTQGKHRIIFRYEPTLKAVILGTK